MKISGETYGPLKVTVDRALTTNVWLNISLKTGKNREVRRIMQKCDLQVNKLVRLEYGKYKLGSVILLIFSWNQESFGNFLSQMVLIVG